VPEQGAALVVANPPYLGEKGRAALFEQLRVLHPHLARWWGPRLDLLYVFLHRGLDLLAPGGWQLGLTSAYWLQATGARRLREDLVTRAAMRRVVLARGARLFEDAPGHESLLFAAQRVASAEAHKCEVVALGEEASRRVVWPGGGEPWMAWRDDALEVSGCARLGALVRDCQGFVSGLDRVTARHVEELERLGAGAQVEPGRAVFLMRVDEVPVRLREAASAWLMPVLRARQVEAWGVQEVAPDEEIALYIDGAVEDEVAREAIEAYLAPVRPLLEARREVGLGRMAWTRLHWPRRRADQRGVKLVMPRRAPRLEVALDLSGALVSSDCTYLVAPEWATDEVVYLARVQAALCSRWCERALHAYGKRKGSLFELYSEPLRALPVPLNRVGDQVEFVAEALGEELGELERHVAQVLKKVREAGLKT
jgi:hypothetical protein